MVNLISSSAVEALMSSYTDLGLTPSHEAQSLDKLPNHWSYYLATSCAVVGAGATLAGIILNSIPIMVGGGLYLLSSGASAFYLHRFSAYQNLAVLTEALAKRVSEFTKQLSVFHSENTTLETQVGRLKADLNNAQSEAVREELQLQNSINGLDNVNKKLEADVAKMEKYKQLADLLDTNVQSLQKQLAASKVQTEQLDKSVVTYKDQVTKWSQENAQLKTQLQTFIDQNKQLRDSNASLESLLKQMRSATASPSTPHVSASGTIKELSDTQNKIQKTLKDISAEEDELDAISAKADKLMK